LDKKINGCDSLFNNSSIIGSNNNNNDVKLDNLDMEMSDDETDNENRSLIKNSSSSDSQLVKGLPIPTINSSLSPSLGLNSRVHLDPRQNNRHQNLMYSPTNLNKSKNEEPVRDEIEQVSKKICFFLL
jgi:hypothetical protein